MELLSGGLHKYKVSREQFETGTKRPVSKIKTPLRRSSSQGCFASVIGQCGSALLYDQALAGHLLDYEISNFARDGYRSRHNLHTWQSHDYLGLGVAAHSCLGGVRFGNSRDLDAFLRGEDITEFRESSAPAEREGEYVMLALRLADGIEEAEFAARFGHGFYETRADELRPFIDAGFVAREGDRTRLTPRGWTVSNAILSELI